MLRENEDGGKRQNYGGRLGSGRFRVSSRKLGIRGQGQFSRLGIGSEGYSRRIHNHFFKQTTRAECVRNSRILSLILPFPLQVCFHQHSIAHIPVSLFPLFPCLQSDRSPRLVTNSLVWVPQGGMLQISRTILHAELPGARDSDITYTITKDQPRHGKPLCSCAVQEQHPSLVVCAQPAAFGGIFP